MVVWSGLEYKNACTYSLSGDKDRISEEDWAEKTRISNEELSVKLKAAELLYIPSGKDLSCEHTTY